MTKQDWAEYDAAAEWQARRGLTGEVGSPLPNMLSETVSLCIAGDPESFADRVRQCAYAGAMNRLNLSDEG